VYSYSYCEYIQISVGCKRDLLSRFAVATQQRHSRLIQSECAGRTEGVHVCVRSQVTAAPDLTRQLTEPPVNGERTSINLFSHCNIHVASDRQSICR
jgi:hypothetical protein